MNTGWNSDERTLTLSELDAVTIAFAAGVGLAFLTALPRDYGGWANDDRLADLRTLLLAKLPNPAHTMEDGVLDVAHALNRLMDNETFSEFLERINKQKENVLEVQAALEERMTASLQ